MTHESAVRIWPASKAWSISVVTPAHTDATETLADLDDAALVAAAAAGRREAFDVIVARHRRSV